MSEASVDTHTSPKGSGRGGRKAGGVLGSAYRSGLGGGPWTTSQETGFAGSPGRNPHGVESDPTAGEGNPLEPENHTIASARMSETTGDRDSMGRSPRSSQRAGKPSTRRRGTVDSACTQGVVETVPVNTGRIPDMQRKLYRWSYNDPSKAFDDLFNLVCDRETLALARQRLARNRGSRTPGTDGITRRKVEQRPGGPEQFLAETRQELREGKYRPEPVRQRLIPKPGKPGKFRPLGIPTLKDRLVQMALKLILEPIWEADFYPTSYGFRKGRNVHQALARIQRHLCPSWAGPSRVTYLIEGDIKGCLDTGS